MDANVSEGACDVTDIWECECGQKHVITHCGVQTGSGPNMSDIDVEEPPVMCCKNVSLILSSRVIFENWGTETILLLRCVCVCAKNEVTFI